MRLFIGLPIPAQLAQTLARAARATNLPNARWTPPENMHLTLVFLGEVADSEARLPAILHELDGLHLTPIRLRLTHLDTFPRAGVLFAEIQPTPTLLHLQSEVATRMARCGFPPPPDSKDERPYHPHLTLARLRSPVRLKSHQTTLPASVLQPFVADTVNLYRSHSAPAGVRYEVLASKAATEE